MRKSRKKGRPRGSVYFHGRSWWIRYAIRGQRVRVNTGLKDPNDSEGAEKILKARLAEAELRIGPASHGRVRFEDLTELLRNHYTNQGNRSLDRAEYSIARLAERFARLTAEDITSARLDAYVAARYQSGVSRGTVRLELAALRLMFRLAVRKKMVSAGDVPDFPSIEPGAARKGFFEPEDFERVLSHLPEHLRAVAAFGHYTGWRKGEILGLQWRAVDPVHQVIRLEADESKNDEARTLAYGQHPALVALLRERDRAAKILQLESGSAERVAWVFWHRDGQPIRDFYTAWRTACEDARVPGRLFHDLRRTAVRHMERSGVSRSVAMKITGHKTETIYRRYAITNEADVAEALGKMAQAPVRFGHNPAPNGDSGATTASKEESQAAES